MLGSILLHKDVIGNGFACVTFTSGQNNKSGCKKHSGKSSDTLGTTRLRLVFPVCHHTSDGAKPRHTPANLTITKRILCFNTTQVKFFLD